MASRWLYMIVGSVLGGLVGAWWSPRSRTIERTEAVHLPAALVDIAPATWESEASSTTPRADETADPLFPLRQLTRLREQGWAQPMVRILDWGDPPRLSPAFRQLYGITPQEEERLLKAVAQAKNAVHQMETALVRAGPGTGEEEGAWVLTIPAFPQEAAHVHDSFVQEFMQTLGPERAVLVNALHGQELESIGDHFGGRERRVVVRRTGEIVGGRQRYEWKDHFHTTDFQGQAAGSGFGRESVLQSLKHLAPHLPPDF